MSSASIEVKLSDATNEQLCARLLHLEEQNNFLLNENSVLRDSIKVYQGLLDENDKKYLSPETSPSKERSGNHKRSERRRRGRGGGEEWEQKRSTKKDTRVSVHTEDITSALGEDALMVGTLNYLTALVKCLSTSAAKRAAVARNQQQLKEAAKSATPGFHPLILPDEGDRDEGLEDTLRHVFADSLHFLCECIIDPDSFFAKEISEYYSALVETEIEAEGVEGECLSREEIKNDLTHPVGRIRHPITWLLNQFPVLPKSKEQGTYEYKDWLPLYWAVATDGDEVVDVETLLSDCGSKDYYELSPPPLLLAISKPEPSMDVSTTLIAFFNERDDDDSEPQAGQTRAENENDKSKIVDIVSIATADGTFPLMFAAAYNEDTELLKTLQVICPKSLWSADSRGWRAIHYATLKGSPTVIRYVLEEHPKSASAMSRSGSLALHHAAQNQREHDEQLLMLSEVFNSNSGAISIADANGALPLHLAAEFGTLEVVQFICQTYPKAVQIKDSEGLLPMHYAGRRNDNSNKIEILRYLTST